MNNVLLHTCCAPCSLSCIAPLRAEGIEPVAFWYNPNIHPWKEYQARRDCLLEYAPTIGMEVRVREDYGLKDFVRHVAGDIDHRCAYCYRHRLEGTAQYAAIWRGVPLPGFPSQLPGWKPVGPGKGLLYAEVLRVRILRAGPLPKADQPGPGALPGGFLSLYII